MLFNSEFCPAGSFHALQTNFFDMFLKVVIGKKGSEDNTVTNITFVAVQEILT